MPGLGPIDATGPSQGSGLHRPVGQRSFGWSPARKAGSRFCKRNLRRLFLYQGKNRPRKWHKICIHTGWSRRWQTARSSGQRTPRDGNRCIDRLRESQYRGTSSLRVPSLTSDSRYPSITLLLFVPERGVPRGHPSSLFPKRLWRRPSNEFHLTDNDRPFA